MPPLVALADVDICNMALSHLGLSTTVASLSPPDQSAQGQACGLWYAKSLAFVLQGAPWRFAFTYTTLAVDASNIPGTTLAFPGWRNAYQYPADCLQPIQVVTQAGLRFGQQYWNSWWAPYPQQLFAVPKIPHEIIQSTANPGQLAIACDLDSTTMPVYLFYIAFVENTAMFDPMFSEALSYELGSKIGGRLRADPAKVQGCAQMASLRRNEALAQHLNSTQQDRERQSPSILTR